MRRDARARFLIAGSLITLIAAAMTFAAFMPAYLTLSNSVRAESQGPTPISASQQAADQLEIKHVNALTHVLSSLVSASSSPTTAIEDAIAARPAEVYLDQILYVAGNPGSLLLHGSTYPDGDSDTEINNYRTALSAEPPFTSVSVPVGALVGTEGGKFTITILGKF